MCPLCLGLLQVEDDLLQADDGSARSLLEQHSSCSSLTQYFSTFRHLPACRPAAIAQLVRESGHSLDEVGLQVQVRACRLPDRELVVRSSSVVVAWDCMPFFRSTRPSPAMRCGLRTMRIGVTQMPGVSALQHVVLLRILQSRHTDSKWLLDYRMDDHCTSIKDVLKAITLAQVAAECGCRSGMVRSFEGGPTSGHQVRTRF